MAHCLLAVDVGGTFTDATLFEPRTAETSRAKAPTTPDDRTLGVLEAAQRALEQADADPEEVGRVLHGTTAATNALLEGTLAPTALVTNEGFQDVLEIGRQNRPALYDLERTRPDPLVPRARRHGLPARLDEQGDELAPVPAEALDEAVQAIADQDVEAVAVGFLHAHRDPSHEQETARRLRDELDAVHVQTSSEVSPEPREVERLTTTVVNAGLVPRLARYLSDLEDRLEQHGIQAPVRILDSAAATTTPEEAGALPVRTVLSGPAAGAAGNRSVAEATGTPTLVGVDMGGTSTDVSLVQQGETSTRWSVEVAGHPLQIPAVDVHTIGAGGGSIAWLDEAGGLGVGPESAGADPGPACYGRGGTRPTVTDANLVLHRIPPSAALGGQLRLDRSLAMDAVTELRPDHDPARTARAILDIAVARSVRGLRSITARHAVDPREASLAAFGGAGPQFGAALARRLGIGTVIVPRAAGVTSTLGLLAAPPRVERSQGVLQRLDAWSKQAYRRETRRLAKRARDGLPEVEQPAIVHRVSARYEGQSHELTVEVPGRDPSRIRQAFEQRHRDQHGYTLDEPVEVVTVRVQALGRAPLPSGPTSSPEPREAPEPVETVEATFLGHPDPVRAPVVDESALEPGTRLEGPTIVASPDTTAIVPPNARARVHKAGHLVVSLEGPS